MKAPQASAAGTECTTVVARGGSFATPAADATVLRRREVAADVRSSQNGFRVARTLP
jgi:formylglycine-generating enzyme required for sulfatase activity